MPDVDSTVHVCRRLLLLLLLPISLTGMLCPYLKQNPGASWWLGVGEVLTTPHRKKLIMLRNIQRGLVVRLILRYDLSSGKGV